uniref:Uncharacterized protein n=1 Tax=Branchiostoma floridae TaxID=7739 RepID=C3ZM64_BRAFL|eukprot:XP_002590309.1 hypothetical protein BRAFLDRAFT_76562 [Branchiostoma floridae]
MQRDESFDFDSRAGIKNHIEERLLKTRLDHLRREQQIRFNVLTYETNKVRQLLRQMPPPLSLSRSGQHPGSPRHVDDEGVPSQKGKNTNDVSQIKRPIATVAWQQTDSGRNGAEESPQYQSTSILNKLASHNNHGGHTHHALEGRMERQNSGALVDMRRCSSVKNGWLGRVRTNLEDVTHGRESIDQGGRRRARTCVPLSRTSTFEGEDGFRRRSRSNTMPLDRSGHRTPGSLTMSRCLTKNMQQNTRRCRSFQVLKTVQMSQQSAVKRTWPVREEISTKLLKNRKWWNVQGVIRQKVQAFLTKDLPPSGVHWADMSDSSDDDDGEMQ